MAINWRWFLERGKERTTWRGIAALAGAAGVAVSPEHWEAITATAIGIVGIIEVVFKEPRVPVPTMREERDG
jgi:hypothetical protein